MFRAVRDPACVTRRRKDLLACGAGAEARGRGRARRLVVVGAALAAATLGAAGSASGGPPTVSVVSGATLSAVWEKGCNDPVPVGETCAFRDVDLQVSPLQRGSYRACLFTAEGIQRSMPEDFEQIERSGCLDGVVLRVAKNGSSATLEPTSIETCTTGADCRVETITATWTAIGHASSVVTRSGSVEDKCVFVTRGRNIPTTATGSLNGGPLPPLTDSSFFLGKTTAACTDTVRRTVLEKGNAAGGFSEACTDNSPASGFTTCAFETISASSGAHTEVLQFPGAGRISEERTVGTEACISFSKAVFPTGNPEAPIASLSFFGFGCTRQATFTNGGNLANASLASVAVPATECGLVQDESGNVTCRARNISVAAVWTASGPAERANFVSGGGPCISHTNAIVRPATMSATFDGQVLSGFGGIDRVLTRRVDCNPEPSG